MTMEDKASRSGVHISGHVGAIYGDVVGGDKVTSALLPADVDAVFATIAAYVANCPTDQRRVASTKLIELKSEISKGDRATDSVVARLVEGLVGLVPMAASALVSTFADPLLSAAAGPATSYVLNKLRDF